MKTKNIVLAGLFIALGLILPFFTGQIPSIGNKLLPIHLPVLLCGFLLGFSGGHFTLEVFIGGAFINSVPGLIIQLVIIPVLLIALKKANLLK